MGLKNISPLLPTDRTPFDGPFIYTPSEQEVSIRRKRNESETERQKPKPQAESTAPPMPPKEPPTP